MTQRLTDEVETMSVAKQDANGPRRRRITPLVPALLMTLLAGLAAWGFIADASPTPDAGAKGAAIELTDFQGEQFTLDDYVGTPVVVNFWASWCPSCAAEMPAFERAYQRLEQQVAFVGINQNDSPEAARELARSTGVTYRLAEDPRGEAFATFGGTGMPTTVFIDEEGNVVELVAGGLSEDQLLSMIEEHLGVRV